MCRALLRFPHLSFIPPVPYPPLRGTFPMRGRLCIGDSDTLVYDALETIFSLSFIPLVPYPARFARHLPHAGKALSVVILFPHIRVFALTMREKRYSRIVVFPLGEGGTAQRRPGALVNDALVTIFPALFHPASPIQPPPLRGTSFPWKGLPSAARRGWPPLCLPHWGKGTAQRRSGAFVNCLFETHFPTLFYTARTLSGSLRSPPSPRGEGFVRRYPFSPRILYSL